MQVKITKSQLKQIIKEELQLMYENAEQQDGPFIKGLAKGLAYTAYPFVKMKNALSSIDHYELIDLDDFVVNDNYKKFGFEGKQIVPTKAKIGAIDSSGKIKEIFWMDIKVMPYSTDNSVGGTLEIDIKNALHKFNLSTILAIKLLNAVNHINKSLTKQYMKDVRNK